MIADARTELRAGGFQVAEIDTRAVEDERGLLTLIGGELNFPDYYRPNWDAFDDCVGDLMREGGLAIAVLITGADTLMHASPYAFARAVHLLYSVVEAVERDAGTFRIEVLVFGRWTS